MTMLPAAAASVHSTATRSAAVPVLQTAFANTPVLHHQLIHGHHVAPPKPRFLFRVPRVVPNQKEKFESDDIMKRHTREGEVSANALYLAAFYSIFDVAKL
jgi:hypothetical protein